MEQKSKVWDLSVEISYLKSACDMNQVDGERNESIYHRKFGMSSMGEGMKCGIV